MHPDHSNYDLSSSGDSDEDFIFSLNYPVSHSQLSASFDNLNIQDNNISQQPDHAPIRSSHSVSRFNPVAVSSVTPSPSFSLSGVEASRSLCNRYLNPIDGSGDYLSSPSLLITSISTAAAPLRATSPASVDLLDPSPYFYFLSTPSWDHLQLHIFPLSLETPYTAEKQHFQRSKHLSSLIFQPSSVPSPLQSDSSYTRRAESVSVTDDRDVNIRRKKKRPQDAAEIRKRVYGRQLRPPKLAPSG